MEVTGNARKDNVGYDSDVAQEGEGNYSIAGIIGLDSSAGDQFPVVWQAASGGADGSASSRLVVVCLVGVAETCCHCRRRRRRRQDTRKRLFIVPVCQTVWTCSVATSDHIISTPSPPTLPPRTILQLPVSRRTSSWLPMPPIPTRLIALRHYVTLAGCLQAQAVPEEEEVEEQEQEQEEEQEQEQEEEQEEEEEVKK
ncbi:hypothetical protein O3P69_010625 [Scylla paramamosain]|uniref:Uncharacterized protein n=1 Tax=Scylla paramamosain TaxID=85552 RepID=A0AAW0TE63_SCYPA